MSKSLVVALSGGIGGAKLAVGLSRIVPAGELVVLVNTGDDFEHLGLAISPDLDTVMYALAGLDDPQRGWGRRDETWSFMAALAAFGGETWFRLGDADLAVHIERTRRLRTGESLSSITKDLCRRLGISAQILPMTDDPVRTQLRTAEDVVDFQDYFVRRGCAPAVLEVSYAGAASARALPQALAVLRDSSLRAVVICPSNPMLSVEPILAVGGMREAIRKCPAPVIAVSPIIGGRAVKGPTAKMLAELGSPVSALAVARRYRNLIDGYIIDAADAADAHLFDVPVTVTKTMMITLADREALARDVLACADSLARAAA